jgi:GntR family transcriptional repressor for pyruvate dehydrogenase complex
MSEALHPLTSDLARRDSPKGYDQVVAYLSDLLMSGALKSGDRLLPERELSLSLGVSRPVVREALRSLAMIGALEIRQGYGTFVRSPDFSSLSNFFTLMIAQSGDVIENIIEVRVALERQAIRLACTRARKHDLDAIEAAFNQIVITIDDPIAGGNADFAFHSRIVEASHSAALIKIYEIVSVLLRSNHISRRELITLTPSYRSFLIDHHEKILQAVCRQDIDESERLLTMHFDIGTELTANQGAAFRN